VENKIKFKLVTLCAMFFALFCFFKINNVNAFTFNNNGGVYNSPVNITLNVEEGEITTMAENDYGNIPPALTWQLCFIDLNEYDLCSPEQDISTLTITKDYFFPVGTYYPTINVINHNFDFNRKLGWNTTFPLNDNGLTIEEKISTSSIIHFDIANATTTDISRIVATSKTYTDDTGTPTQIMISTFDIPVILFYYIFIIMIMLFITILLYFKIKKHGKD
jgi:hypothetical protein